MSFPLNPFLKKDAYKLGHPFQYPEGTEFVTHNFTPRQSRMEGVNEMVFFGLQTFVIETLINDFDRNFFNRKRGDVIDAYRRQVRALLGSDLPSYDHIEYVHRMGYLPLHLKALPEGTLVPMRVPAYTLVNTDAACGWLPNTLETIESDSLWQACTSATIAHEFRKLLDRHAEITGMPPEFVQWQGHDFSMRGMSSYESAVLSGMGHLLSFTGTDTLPAIAALEYYYGANVEKELVGGSVAATEHAVMCAGGKGTELATFHRLINQVYPQGIVSIVSDTWDLWKVLTEYLPALKEEILTREGKVVIRPDSGDPVKILCGDPESNIEPVRKGVIECLWDVFGGTYLTGKGGRQFKLLDSHVGAIYGDSINRARADQICSILATKGFASQCVFGIGSYTYQYNTRDTFGTAIKATHVVINGEAINIFKDPATDDGMKKSATGLLRVDRDEAGKLILREGVTPAEEKGGLLETVFKNGVLVRRHTLAEIRERLAAARAAAKALAA